MPKLSSEQKARLEIEFIEKSKETDKYDYEIKNNYHLALLAALISLILGISNIIANDRPVPLWLYISAGLISLILIVWPLIIYPITKEYKKKHLMARQRYRTLGIDPEELDKELKFFKNKQ